VAFVFYGFFMVVRSMLGVMSYAWGLSAVLAATLLNAWGGAYFDIADRSMIYLFAVALIASRLPRGPSLLAAFTSVAALDFFFVEPRYTFMAHDARHFVTFAVMLVVSLLVSGLTVQIREQAHSAIEQRMRTEALYTMSSELAVTRGLRELAQVALRFVRERFQLEATIVIARPALEIAAGPGPLNASAIELAERAIELGRTIGGASEIAPSAQYLALPMEGPRGPVGAFLVRLPRSNLTPSMIRALELFVAQATPAIERGLLADEAEKALVTAEHERTRNTLLAGIAHDLRNPLAAIEGSATALLDPKAPPDRELLEAIRDESGRLARMVTGLLDLVRLESGALTVNKEWCPVEEVLASAVGRLDRALAERPVRTQLGSEGELLLAPVDPVLFEQVFINLLDNAAKYSPAGSPIDVRAWSGGDEVVVEVEDRGVGVPAGEEDRIFEKFYRAADGHRVPGAGLGLAVCDAIVKAHGGRIGVKRAGERGAIFSIGLPLAGVAT
jgi:two-component system, OmpR family, sensor histidine kinase KdpD